MRTGFQRTFWVANTIELFERFAYYGSMAVLSVYLADKIGLDKLTVGILFSIFTGVLYSLPIVAGTFVDRYGFKRSLVACFSFFTIGYFLIGLAGLPLGSTIIAAVGKISYLATILLFTAIGGSLIKPCIVGTVAKTTTRETKALGYSIYYTLVNIGGAVGPILALQVRQNFGIEYVLVMSSVTSCLLICGALFFYKEPPRDPGTTPQTSLVKVFRDMLLVFTNFKFISFLIIFSGFWIMFWQIFSSLPFYVKEVLKFEDFELLETVDAWSIIFLTIPVAAMTKKLKPIVAMVVGFSIASSAWLVMGASRSVPATIVAMFLFALGEAIQAPRFYEYVADLAPKEQIGTFMGFAFLPIAIGSFIAGPLGGWLAQTYIRPTSVSPETMWMAVAEIGFLSTLLMILYDRLVVRNT
jgi:proton-dependent oligopeptide transporter, POT family